MAYRRSTTSPINAVRRSNAGYRIGIVVAQWHSDITQKLLNSAIKTLKEAGISERSILIRKVPGSFELPIAAQWLTNRNSPDAVICIGCIIKGETPHFKFIAQAVATGITELSLKHNIPFLFGVLTTNTLKQAKERSGGKFGNKGNEAAQSALELLNMMNNRAGDRHKE